MISFSVIVPVYNVEKYLKRSLENLVNQTYDEFEVILINDGSTDESGQICDVYSETYSNIQVIHQKNSGSGRARQNGINQAKGNYIIFVDPDDYLDVSALECNAQILEENQVDILINGFYEIRKDLFGKTYEKQYTHGHPGLYNRKDFITSFSKINEGRLKPLWNKIYRLNFLMKNNIDFSEQRLGQDVLFNYKAFMYTQTVFINDNTYYHYDSTREGSAVNKYWDKRFKYELNIHNAYLELLDSFGNPKELYQEKLLSLWYAVLVEMRNINYIGSTYITNAEKISRIQEISNLSIFDEVFNKLKSGNINSLVSSYCFKLLKGKKYRLAQLLISTYVKLK